MWSLDVTVCRGGDAYCDMLEVEARSTAWHDHVRIGDAKGALPGEWSKGSQRSLVSDLDDGTVPSRDCATDKKASRLIKHREREGYFRMKLRQVGLGLVYGVASIAIGFVAVAAGILVSDAAGYEGRNSTVVMAVVALVIAVCGGVFIVRGLPRLFAGLVRSTSLGNERGYASNGRSAARPR